MNSERKGKASSNFQIDLVWIFLDNIIPPPWSFATHFWEAKDFDFLNNFSQSFDRTNRHIGFSLQAPFQLSTRHRWLLTIILGYINKFVHSIPS